MRTQKGLRGQESSRCLDTTVGKGRTRVQSTTIAMSPTVGMSHMSDMLSTMITKLMPDTIHGIDQGMHMLLHHQLTYLEDHLRTTDHLVIPQHRHATVHDPHRVQEGSGGAHPTAGEAQAVTGPCDFVTWAWVLIRLADPISVRGHV